MRLHGASVVEPVSVDLDRDTTNAECRRATALTWLWRMSRASSTTSKTRIEQRLQRALDLLDDVATDKL
ncbi:hypothetical protein BJF84_15620 [Rhodococcus sp. CUA-806]|nr:hypothetical protein BJF84_26050 [Rhodococcus sp. CUA-806]OLT34985.1 hypothetical protein BJF84_15620 [Rhodococcus sp. CUA-806]